MTKGMASHLEEMEGEKLLKLQRKGWKVKLHRERFFAT